MKKVSIEKLFLIIGFIFGCILIYTIPPFQSPDEDSHFKKAYTISEGNFFSKSNGTIIGLKIPNSMDDYINNKLTMMGDRSKKYTYLDCYYDQLLPGDFSKKTLKQVSTSNITPIAHLIPATGIMISKLLGPLLVNGTPSTALMLSFARIFSLAAYLLIGYQAIKHTPVFKKSMFAILLMPMSIYLASVVSYDNLLISISLLAVAFMLKLIYEKNEVFNKKYFWLFTVIGYILLNVKTVYAPILALLIFVPKEKFKNKDSKEKIKTYLKLGAAIILLTILLKIPNMLLESEVVESLSGKQLSFVISHPFTYLKILLLNLKDQFWPQIYWMTGTFGLLDTYIPPLFIFLSLINLLLTFITDGIYEKIKINYKFKIVVGMALLLGIVGMYTAMYIYWTPEVLGKVGGNGITGVQGRYFLPLLIGLPLLFSNNILKKKKKVLEFSKNYFDKSVVIITTCLIVSIIVIITRFWI